MDTNQESKFKNVKTEGTLIIVLMLLIITISIASILIYHQNRFLFGDNPYNLVRQMSMNGIVSLGMLFVIISGGIDLSVGSIAGLSCMTVALLLKNGMNISLSIIIAVGISIIFGLINGILIFDGKLPAFIATLGTMTIIRAIIMLISGARLISGLPSKFTSFAQVNLVGLPSLSVVWLFFILIALFISTKTRFGRNVYTIGSSLEVARLCGINIRLNIYMVYVFSAFMSAIAGVLMASRLANGVPNAGQGYEMDAIASCVVGGASLSGAEGTVIGMVLGTIIIAVIKNGGNILGIDPFILQIINGVLIIGAVFLDQVRKQHSN
jgi:ribose transport system permease protein